MNRVWRITELRNTRKQPYLLLFNKALSDIFSCLGICKSSRRIVIGRFICGLFLHCAVNVFSLNRRFQSSSSWDMHIAVVLFIVLIFACLLWAACSLCRKTLLMKRNKLAASNNLHQLTSDAVHPVTMTRYSQQHPTSTGLNVSRAGHQWEPLSLHVNRTGRIAEQGYRPRTQPAVSRQAEIPSVSLTLNQHPPAVSEVDTPPPTYESVVMGTFRQVCHPEDSWCWNLLKASDVWACFYTWRLLERSIDSKMIPYFWLHSTVSTYLLHKTCGLWGKLKKMYVHKIINM